jgi:hypothetical protein
MNAGRTLSFSFGCLWFLHGRSMKDNQIIVKNNLALQEELLNAAAKTPVCVG